MFTNQCMTKDLYIPDNEVGPGVDHCPLLIQHVLLLVSVDNVVLLHLLQRVRSSRFVANLYLSRINEYTMLR